MRLYNIVRLPMFSLTISHTAIEYIVFITGKSAKYAHYSFRHGACADKYIIIYTIIFQSYCDTHLHVMRVCVCVCVCA